MRTLGIAYFAEQMLHFEAAVVDFEGRGAREAEEAICE